MCLSLRKIDDYCKVFLIYVCVVTWLHLFVVNEIQETVLIAGMTLLHDFSILLLIMENQTYFPVCQMQDYDPVIKIQQSHYQQYIKGH